VRLSEELGTLRTEVARLDAARRRAGDHVKKVLHASKMPIGAAAAAIGVPEQHLAQLAQRIPDHQARSCSFCTEQGRLVAGPDVAICWECVPRVKALGGGNEADPSVPMWVAAPDAHCSFCGKTAQAADYLVRGLVGEICSECVELCEDIIAEETVSRGGTGA
jgi:hypothetical protein